MTAVSISHLTYPLSYQTTGYNVKDFNFNYMNVFIWTSIEVNVCIVFGQYMTAFSVRSRTEGRWLTLRPSLSSLACLPSLGPVLPFVSEKLKLLRNRRSTHKRGSQLLMDMLPARKSASPPVLPLSRQQSLSDEPIPMLDSSIIVEMAAKHPRAPELDAEAPGPHILEIGTLEPVLKMESRRPTAELEG